MRDRAMRDHARKAVDNLTRIDRAMDQPDAFGKTILDRMTDHEVGHPRSPSFEAGTGPAPIEDLPDELRGRLSYNDPTGQAGVQVAMVGDKAAQLRKEVGKRLERMSRDSEFVVWAFSLFEPRPANVIEREAAGRNDEPGCESCARLAGAHGQPRWEPVSVEKAKVGDTTMRLCRWCADHLRATGDVPTRAQVDAHHSGKRVSRSVA